MRSLEGGPALRAARTLLGLAEIGLGIYLLADPFARTAVLASATGAALLLAGAGDAVGAGEAAPGGARRGRWVAALVSACAGVLVLAWPAISLRALAVAAGVGLILSGAARAPEARRLSGEQRLVICALGASAVIGGVLALAWPGVSVLGLALIVGLRAIAHGVWRLSAAFAGAANQWPHARWAELRRARPALPGAALVLTLAGLGASIALHTAGGVRPGPFYDPPAPLPRGHHGRLIRSEEILHFYPGARAWRVLYRSTSLYGVPDAVSGLVVVPDGPAPRGGRRVIAFTHGTVGIARSCAPSLRGAAAAPVIEGLGQFIAAGDVVAATDYSGLGTPGPHPYLVGRVEAMNALDAVRAARALPEAHAGRRFAVWGHSQGGQAALFTAQLASSYTPELQLVGVAAGAPVPEPVALLKANLETPGGRVLIAFAVDAWSQVYRGAKLSQILAPGAAAAVAQAARVCLYGKQLLGAMSAALSLGRAFFSRPPWETEPWRSIIAENTPGRTPIGVPVLLVQGGADKIVAPALTVRLARRLCGEGETVQLRLYPSAEHVEAGIVASPDVASWMAERFAGRPAPSTCSAHR